MSVHLVIYANNEPFRTTQRLMMETIHKFTSKNVIIHDYNAEKISKLEWYELIKDFHLPPDRMGKRDGSYNAWKAFITRDVYNEMQEGDILYYIDCSQYFVEGFTQNIDNAIEDFNELVWHINDNVIYPIDIGSLDI